MAPRTQLRMYEIRTGELDEFVREWRAGVVPLREKFGFRVDGAWVVEGEDRFVWLLTYIGDGTFEESDAVYYASPERHALQPDPARHIARPQTWMISALMTD
jgi:hypothetical protein